MGCGPTWQAVRQTESALRLLEQEGFGPETAPYAAIWQRRVLAIEQMGKKATVEPYSLLTRFGRSPGIFKLWNDPEKGWFVEARRVVGALPIYRFVSDDIAKAVLRDKLTHEQETALLTPDPYIGE